MKRWILFVLCILAFQIDYKFAPVLAQENKDALEVKKVIETFVKGIAYRDIDSTMQYISVNYSEIRENNIIDYAKAKSDLENQMNNFFKNHIDYSISDLKLDNLDIQDNKATLEVEWRWKGFNSDTLKEDSGKKKRLVSLAKENNIWKIIQWRHLQ